MKSYIIYGVNLFVIKMLFKLYTNRLQLIKQEKNNKSFDIETEDMK